MDSASIMMLWNLLLSVVVGIIGYIVKDKFEFKELNAKTEMLTIDEIIKKIKKLKG